MISTLFTMGKGRKKKVPKLPISIIWMLYGKGKETKENDPKFFSRGTRNFVSKTGEIL